jgi:hypothetical protein
MKPFNKEAKRVTLTAKVDLATKRHFQELCREWNTSPSQRIAQMVTTAIANADLGRRFAKKLRDEK